MTIAEAGSGRQARSREAVLAAIRQRGDATRGEITSATGLSTSAVNEIVRALLALHLIEERGESPVSRGTGRPARRLILARRTGFVAGIDFGHEHVAVAVAETGGKMIADERRGLDVDANAGAALELAATMLRRLCKQTKVRPGDLGGIVAGIPGPLDLSTGIVQSPTILSTWVDLDAAAELSDRIGATVHVANDADLGAQGELRFGAARNFRDFIYIKASHGVGAGLVLDGRSYRGSSGIAGEIGHTQIAPTGHLCRCGNRGCLESVASVTNIKQQLQELGLAIPASGTRFETVAGNPSAARLFAEAGRTLGKVVADLCNCLNPDAVILGGELASAGKPVLDGMIESINRYAQPASAQQVKVTAAQLGQQAELFGAIAQASGHANGSSGVT